MHSTKTSGVTKANSPVTTPTPDNSSVSPTRDRGFTLVEIIAVVVILGILSVVVAFSVRGVTDQAEASACGADARTLTMAADSYLAKEQVDTLPAMGTTANRYELALIDAGMLAQVSTRYDLQADGTVTTNGQPCT